MVKFIDAPSNRRARQVELVRLQGVGDYSPATDFWKPMRDAIYRDRKTIRDGTVVQRAVEVATSKKRPSYQAVADKWPSIARRWRDSSFRIPSTSTVVIGGLEVRVKPLFREVRPDGTVDDVSIWMNREEPQDDAINGALRLLTRAGASPDSTATFVDVRRGELWSSQQFEMGGLDDWLDEVGAEFIRLWGP
ncbi:MAG TPA: hypothetical protein VHU90_09485 [Galbitalea sp.]|nr:hypothetical protein [Galbitalea sp.]